MKKVLKTVGVCIIALLGIGVAVYLSNKEEEEPPETETVNAETEQPVQTPVDDGNLVMDEEMFMQIMHEMTHQKVKADTKWGYTPMTEEQIDRMLAILDQNDFQHEKFYREALTAWKNGDFSNAVKVHNKIWKWQGGNIGKAYGLLSPEEEKEYIETQSKKMEKKK
jgi:hypothetical protein